MTEETVRLHKDDLHAFAEAIFIAAGVEASMAATWARVLVWANLRGVDSHGVLRIPRYIDLLAKGGINAKPRMQIERRAGAMAVLEADKGPGAVAMARAMDEAIAHAREVHLGWCAVRNLTHAGAVGYFALQATKAGMIGLVMTASGPMMAYHGARAAGLSTNPLAIAVPAGQRRPYLLDMSTATVANGKILEARDKGVQVPIGWGIDAEGRDTADPSRIATLLPVGGPKGSGLSFMIECLCSLMVGNPRIAPSLASARAGDSPLMNGIAMAIDISAISDLDRFRADADRLGDEISRLPPAQDVDQVLLPGERGDKIWQERERDGIPIPSGTWSRLLATAKSLGITAPETIAVQAP